MTLKERFLTAVIRGELGTIDDAGVQVSLKQFRAYFKEIDNGYLTTFLPTAVIETGQNSATQTKFLFRIRKGVYRIHPDAIAEQRFKMQYIIDNDKPDTEVKEDYPVYLAA